MALRDYTLLVPGLFDCAVHGNVTQLQSFMNEFMSKFLLEDNCNAELSWLMPMKDASSEHARYFIIQRDGIAISYGAVSTRQTTGDMKEEVARRFNEKVLVPQKTNGGYVSVTAKGEKSLNVEFALVHRAEQGAPRVDPVLPGMSTVELNDNNIENAEKAFRCFLEESIKFLPIPA